MPTESPRSLLQLSSDCALLLALALTSACERTSTGSVHGTASGGAAGTSQGGGGASGGVGGEATETVSAACEPSTLVAPVQLPWVPHTDVPTCQHAEVVRDCTDGWCTIPAGCFVMGSPEDEPGRAANGETLTTVELTRSFVMGRYEVTRSDWSKTGWALPYGDLGATTVTRVCDDPECPMTRVSWFGAMLYANWLSENSDPPLSPCYLLDGCTSDAPYALSCESVTVNTESQRVYDCEGYRLPTAPEWEYAARAGSRTAYLTGPMSAEAETDIRYCLKEVGLEDYAWYCNNASNQIRHVGCKGANAWGLQDVLGNVDEFVSNPAYTSFYAYPPVDPWGDVSVELPMASRGGRTASTPEMARLAGGLLRSKGGATGTGFRLVRQIAEQ